MHLMSSPTRYNNIMIYYIISFRINQRRAGLDRYCSLRINQKRNLCWLVSEKSEEREMFEYLSTNHILQFGPCSFRPSSSSLIDTSRQSYVNQSHAFLPSCLVYIDWCSSSFNQQSLPEILEYGTKNLVLPLSYISHSTCLCYWHVIIKTLVQHQGTVQPQIYFICLSNLSNDLTHCPSVHPFKYIEDGFFLFHIYTIRGKHEPLSQVDGACRRILTLTVLLTLVLQALEMNSHFVAFCFGE